VENHGRHVRGREPAHNQGKIRSVGALADTATERRPPYAGSPNVRADGLYSRAHDAA